MKAEERRNLLIAGSSLFTVITLIASQAIRTETRRNNLKALETVSALQVQSLNLMQTQLAEMQPSQTALHRIITTPTPTTTVIK